MNHQKMISLLTLILLSAGFNQKVLAAEEWEFEVTPYIFGSALSGTTGIKGVEADLDMSFSDILENLDGGFMGLFTARQGRWKYNFEAVYFKLKTDDTKSISGPGGRLTADGALEVSTQMNIYQAGLGYAWIEGTTSVDLIAALRNTNIDLDADLNITATPSITFEDNSLSASISEGWTDLVVGARATHTISENVDLVGYFDVGAGDSDLTYQLLAGVNWEFSEGYYAKVAYRVLDWDYEDNGFKWDMQADGALLGLGIRF